MGWMQAGVSEDETGPVIVARLQEWGFDVASISKLFTSVAVLQLVAAGRLDLDAPISTYLTYVDGPQADITTRQLVAFTSGLEYDEKMDPIARRNAVGYPMRAIRTAKWAYIRNYAPDRWPAARSNRARR